MFPAQLHNDLIASSTRALKTLNDVLDSSDKDAQRVSAALGILRLTERVFNKFPLPEGGGRGVGSAGASSPPRTCAPKRSRPLPSSSHPLITAAGRASSPDSRSRPLEPEEITELNTYYTLQPSRVHDPTMAEYWRDRLSDGRNAVNRLAMEAQQRITAAAESSSIPP